MQINKGEGVFVKWEGEVTLLATWPVVMMRGSGDIKEKTFGREALNEEREGEYTPYKTKESKGEIHAFLPLKRSPNGRLAFRPKIGQTRE